MKSLFENLKSNIGLFVVPIAFIAIALFAKVFVLSDHKNEVTHQNEIVRSGYEPSPETFTVYPSPAKAWELTHLSPASRTFDAIAVIFFWIAIAALILGALDLTPLKPGQLLIAVVFSLLAWVSFKYSAYSSAVSNTTVILSPREYNNATQTPDGLDELFNGKEPL